MMSTIRKRAKVLVSILVLALLQVGLTSAAQSAAEKLVKGPVIQNVRTDRAILTWVSQKTQGEPKNGGTDATTIGDPIFHQIELTGLQPGSRCEYDLSSHGVDAKGSFLTAPTTDAPYTFVVYGDTRSRHDVHRRVIAKVIAEKPAFVLHSGDLVNNGLNPEDWDQFFEIEGELLRNTPFYPALGNHDRNAPVFFKYFSFPGGNGHHYSFDYGSAHFVALDSNHPGTSNEAKLEFMNEQVDWLKNDLKKNRKPLTFVYFHHPLYTAVENRRDGASEIAKIYEQTLIKGGASAVFGGHDHNYQHHLVKGLHHVVSGGGGAPLYDVSPIPGITLKAVKTENYVRVQIDGARAKFDAFDISGNLLDSFEITGRTDIR